MDIFVQSKPADGITVRFRMLILLLLSNSSIGLMSCKTDEEKLDGVPPVRCDVVDPVGLDSFKNVVLVQDTPLAISSVDEITFKSVSEHNNGQKVELLAKQDIQNPLKIDLKLDSPIAFISVLREGVWLKNLKIADNNLTADLGKGLLPEMAFDKPKVDVVFGVEADLIVGQQYKFANSTIYYAGYQLTTTEGTAWLKSDLFVVTSNVLGSGKGEVCWHVVEVASYGDLSPVEFWADGSYYSIELTVANGFIIDKVTEI